MTRTYAPTIAKSNNDDELYDIFQTNLQGWEDSPLQLQSKHGTPSISLALKGSWIVSKQESQGQRVDLASGYQQLAV